MENPLSIIKLSEKLPYAYKKMSVWMSYLLRRYFGALNFPSIGEQRLILLRPIGGLKLLEIQNTSAVREPVHLNTRDFT